MVTTCAVEGARRARGNSTHATPKAGRLIQTGARGFLGNWKRHVKLQLLALLFIVPHLHSASFKSCRGLHTAYYGSQTLDGEPHAPKRVLPAGFLGCPLSLQQHSQQQQQQQHKSNRNTKSICLLRSGARTPSERDSALWGARSNRINGKRPSVLPSPSPFPGALVHLLPGASVLPNEAYVGQHVRLPVSPSSDLSLTRSQQGPPRLFAPRPQRLNARKALQKQGLPLTRLRWPQDASLQQRQQQQEVLRTETGEALTFEYLAESGDRYPAKKAFGEQAPLFKHHLHFGRPLWPNAIVDMAKEYNKQIRETGKETETVPEEWICDTIFCDESGRVLRMRERAAPYGGEDEPDSGPTTWELLKLRSEREKRTPPHRFIVTAPAGYVAKAGITVGMQFPMLNDEQLATVYNNHFAQPKKFREPLILPDGTCIP